MSESERERQLLQEALSEAHRSTGERTPPFELLWSRAAARAEEPRRARSTARRARFAFAVAAALALTMALVLWTGGRRGAGDFDRAMTVAAEVGAWRAPLDFLLDTPGREWLEAPPSWDPGAAAAWSLAPDLPQTYFPMPDSLEEVPR